MEPESGKGLAGAEPVCAEQALVVGEGAAPPRRKRTSWTQAREARFLEVLATTSNVAEAIRESGLSETSVYRRRQASPAFCASWENALGEGYVRLEAMMLQRAMGGVEKDVWHRGEVVGKMREYSNQLGLALLARHRSTVRGERGRMLIATETIEVVRERLSVRLSEINREMGGAG